MNIKHIWTTDELTFLQRNYPMLGPTEVSKHLNIGLDSVKHKAKFLSLSFNYLKNRNSDLSILLEDTELTYYWIGFILADGHFNKQERLVVQLNNQDKEHVYKLAAYIKSSNITTVNNNTKISSQDKVLGPIICNKFEIQQNKTKYPPTVSLFANMPFNLLLSLLIGFIDGDGCIRTQTGRKDCLIQLKGHSSWLLIYKEFEKILNDTLLTMSTTCKLNASGFSIMTISNKKAQHLKQFAETNQLPILTRKWDKVELN